MFTHLTSLIFGRPTTEMQRYVSVGICQCLQALLVTLREVLCRASVYSMISRKCIPTSSTDVRCTFDREVRIEPGRRRAAMTPRWSNAIVFAALFSLCVDVLISSNEDTLVKCVNIRKLKISKNNLTMNLTATPRMTVAAGHSGQNNTVSRSAMRLSNIARYSASLAFLVDFVFPDLQEH